MTTTPEPCQSCHLLTAEVERLQAIAEEYQVHAESLAGDGSHLDPALAELRFRLSLRPFHLRLNAEPR